MKYRALRSFSGLINMSRGEEREISDEYIAGDLLKAGYIEAVEVTGSPGDNISDGTCESGIEEEHSESSDETAEEFAENTAEVEAVSETAAAPKAKAKNKKVKKASE